MSWFRRKGETDNASERDPRIDMARLKNQQSELGNTKANRPKRSDQPLAIDSEFCYGGDAGPCA